MRIIIFAVLILFIYYAIKGYFFSQKKVLQHDKAHNDDNNEEEMVLDNICKTYLPKDSVLRVKNGNTIHYFCGAKCREKYLKSLTAKV